jgi:hypothetical protein
MKMFKTMVIAVFMVVVLTVVAVIAVLINPKLAAVPTRTFESLGGGYKVIVYVYPLPSVAMPGQGSDHDGFVRVYDTTSGAMLCQIDVPLAGQLDTHAVRWGGNSVAVLGYEGFESCRLP